MLSRLIFTIFTVIFLAYTWLHAGQASSNQSLSSLKHGDKLHETYLDVSGIY